MDQLGTGDVAAHHMLWDCASCGTRRLLGASHQHCPACGSAQDQNPLYAPPDEGGITAEDHSLIGRDLLCLACEIPSSAAANYCRGCGCPLAGAREIGQRDAFGRAEGFAGQSGAFAQAALERSRRVSAKQQLASGAAHDAAADAIRSRRRSILAGVGILAIGLVFMRAREGGLELRVVEHSWSRTIEIEQFSEVRATTLCDDMPARAKLIREKTGTDKCEYRLNEWHTVRELRAEGSGLTPEPSWPDIRLRTTGEGNCLLCERTGVETERYVVSFSYDDTVDTCELDFVTWQSIAIGDGFSGQPDPQTGRLNCDSIVAQ
ncbi:hypothetical protein [Enhygromyxa salina]|uniref:Double zinc ribbon n=1 Tax=Enhygromyxa salina TaxID=215803 RepID=A0A2S9YMG9_9BACT|nr:hypothetical protein [Enhygromyxa salina]PRQ06282.1 hypothetical protein ENSA7_39590 [Enhygromyxa salina]